MINLEQKFNNDKKFKRKVLFEYKSFLTDSILSGDRCEDWQAFEHEGISYDINLQEDLLVIISSSPLYCTHSVHSSPHLSSP